MTYDELYTECCSQCKGWDKPCPVAILIGDNNFEYKMPEHIMMYFTDGKLCKMFEMFKKELMLSEDEKNQLELVF